MNPLVRPALPRMASGRISINAVFQKGILAHIDVAFADAWPNTFRVNMSGRTQKVRFRND